MLMPPGYIQNLLNWKEPRPHSRSRQDRSCYAPHANARECERHMRQVFAGQLEMAGSYELFKRLLDEHVERLNAA